MVMAVVGHKSEIIVLQTQPNSGHNWFFTFFYCFFSIFLFNENGTFLFQKKTNTKLKFSQPLSLVLVKLAFDFPTETMNSILRVKSIYNDHQKCLSVVVVVVVKSVSIE